MKAVILLLAVGLVGCGGGSDKPRHRPRQEPPVIPEPVTPPESPGVKAIQTPGMKAARKAPHEGRHAEVVRLYSAELATEEAKPKPRWEQLSHPNGKLCESLAFAGQYDKALEHHQEALAIFLKKLGPNHPHTKDAKANWDELKE